MNIRRSRSFATNRRIFIRAARLLGFVAAVSGMSAVLPGISHFTQAADELVIVAFGDSLTAGYRLPPTKSFPAQLETALKAKGHHIRVLNAGVSGDTASGGLARLDWAIPEGADAVIVELGANDALRAIDPAATKAALDAILARLKAKRIDILLTGIEAPRGLGGPYTKAFSAIFPALAKKHGALLYPFFLQNIALKPDLNLADGLHPNANGVAVIVESILPSVEALIERAQKKKSGSRRSPS